MHDRFHIQKISRSVLPRKGAEKCRPAVANPVKQQFATMLWMKTMKTIYLVFCWLGFIFLFFINRDFYIKILALTWVFDFYYRRESTPKNPTGIPTVLVASITLFFVFQLQGFQFTVTLLGILLPAVIWILFLWLRKGRISPKMFFFLDIFVFILLNTVFFLSYFR